MPKKWRLPILITSRLTLGNLDNATGASPGTTILHLIAGSVSVNVGSVGAVAGSTVSEVATIPGLTASHALVANEEQGTQNACLLLQSSKAGAGQASLTWAYTAGSALATAASHAATIRFIAAKT